MSSVTWICERCRAKFKLLCSCAKCLGRSWHRRTDEQMSARINWLEKVFQAPVQSMLVGDIRQECTEPHLQQWQTFRNRMGWLSRQCGCRFLLLCLETLSMTKHNKPTMKGGKKKVCISSSGPETSGSLCSLAGNWFWSRQKYRLKERRRVFCVD